MKKIQSNLHYYKISKENPEKFLDQNYMFVEKDLGMSFYVSKTHKIKELLTTIKNIKNKNNSEKLLNEIFLELQNTIKKYSNYSEFGCFINACDSTIEENINDIKLLKTITFLYLEKRKLTDIVPSEWLQAIIDKGSSRKKGHAGEKKIMDILEGSGFLKAKDIPDFKNYNKCSAKLSKRGKFSNKNIKKFFGISIGNKNQDKSLDVIVKNGKEVFFIEAKHLNTGGGGQHKQVLDLIEIIRKNNAKNNYHFVAFLDGVFSNTLLSAGSEAENKEEAVKTKLQYKDIMEALNKNQNNFWVNTAGFRALFSD